MAQEEVRLPPASPLDPLRKWILAPTALTVLLLTGCMGWVFDLLLPSPDNLIASEDFTPDPQFGAGRNERSLGRPYTAADIGKLPGIVWLELVVGPESSLAGDASGVMVEFAGKPHVLSAGHIVRGPKLKAIYAYFSEGRKNPEEVEIVVADETLDFSLLRFKDPAFRYDTYPALGDSRSLRKGDKVFPFGSPFGYDFMVREGVINKLDFGINYRGFRQPQMILHDATINPGDSGGPLFNDRGEVVGINVMGIHPGLSRSITTIYAAIPIDDVKTVLRGVKRSGYVRHPRIGWKLFDTAGLNPLNFRDKKVPKPRRDGLMVYEVVPGQPAETAGLRVGDIVLSLDGRVPPSCNEAARYILFERQPGDEVEVRVYRETHRTEPEIRPDPAGYLTVYYTYTMTAEELRFKVKLE
jgi:S1-C subfamily serine protease